jgi:hypothetical protein
MLANVHLDPRQGRQLRHEFLPMFDTLFKAETVIVQLLGLVEHINLTIRPEGEVESGPTLLN